MKAVMYGGGNIGRMESVQTEQIKTEEPMRVCVEKYGFLPVDKAAFKGEISMAEILEIPYSKREKTYFAVLFYPCICIGFFDSISGKLAAGK